MRVLYLVRHGRPLIDRTRPAHEWPLDPAYADDVRALRPRLPKHASWFSSPEPKALATARLLTDQPVEVVPDLREHERHTSDWIADFEPSYAARSTTSTSRRTTDGSRWPTPDAVSWPPWPPSSTGEPNTTTTTTTTLSSSDTAPHGPC